MGLPNLTERRPPARAFVPGEPPNPHYAWAPSSIPMPPTLYLLQILLQAVSSFAIAAGLIFTAVQFRQARKAQLVANFSKLVELQYQLRELRVEHPDLASVYEHDVEHLHSE